MQIDDANLTPRQRQQIAAALGQDPGAVMVRCEAPGCTRQMALADAYSMALVYRMPGRGRAPYQCPQEQHFACSHVHAKAAMLACLQTHIEQGDHA